MISACRSLGLFLLSYRSVSFCLLFSGYKNKLLQKAGVTQELTILQSHSRAGLWFILLLTLTISVQLQLLFCRSMILVIRISYSPYLLTSTIKFICNLGIGLVFIALESHPDKCLITSSKTETLPNLLVPHLHLRT